VSSISLFKGVSIKFKINAEADQNQKLIQCEQIATEGKLLGDTRYGVWSLLH